MQKSYFSNGGYVVHKALDGRTSAWFDSNGKLLDAEFKTKNGHMRAIKPTEHKWQQLQEIYGSK